MRIGIDARFYGSLGKGLGRYTEKLLEGLEAENGLHDYFVFLRRENFDEYTPRQPRFHKVLADFAWYGWEEQWHFPRLLSRYRLDLVHFPHFNVPLLYRRPFLVTIHDLILLRYPTIKASELSPFLYWIKYWVYRLVIASAIDRSRCILTVSHFTENDIATHYPKALGKIRVTYEAAGTACAWVAPAQCQTLLRRFQLNASETELVPKPFVLYVGNAYPHKNLGLFLDLAKRFPELLFVLVGREDYFYRRLKTEAADRRLANVHFLGFVSDRDLSVLYRLARVYLFPSLYEGFGLPALEACLHGLPVMASKRGSLPEVLGEAALFFDPEQLEAAIKALRSLLDNALLRNAFSEAGMRRVRDFDWRRMARETLTAYESLLSSQR